MTAVLEYFEKKSRLFFFVLCGLFLVVASLQSLVPHYQFYTNNWDLGFHNQLMYKWAHFKRPGGTLWNPQYYLTNCLGDHFTLLMPLNSQLYWIFGSYSMLIVQIIYCLLGATGLYKLIQFKCASNGLALLGVLIFFTHYSLYAALAFDTHDNVYGMMFLPWILLNYYKGNFKSFILTLLLFLMAREDLALTGIFLGMALFVLDRSKRKYGITCFVTSLSYFVIVYHFVMPSMSSVPWGYNAWRFNELGKSLTDAFHTSLAKPIYILGLFFNQPEKRDKFTYFLLTGGILLLVQPRFSLIFIPTFLITCLSSEWGLWGNKYHYNIIFAVLLPFIIITTATLIKNNQLKIGYLLLAVTMNIVMLCKNQLSGSEKFGRIFKADYYNKRSNLAEIYEGLSLIPPNAPVSAISHLTPHLAFRDRAYFFPDIKDADYIAINQTDGLNDFFPCATTEEFQNAVQQARERNDYELIYDKKNMLVFRRKR